MIELRRKIKKEREETVYRQMEARQAFFENCAIIGLVLALFAIIFGGFWLMGTGAGWF